MVLLILFSAVLVGVSALCSGLNVALMSLDVTDIRRRAKLGDRDAKRALRVREKTHLSLASILFTNVAVISASSLVLSSFLNGIVAGLLSTMLIVVFGEILPQAFAVKHSLRAISVFAPFLQFITLLTYPIAKPLELLLDKLIGADNSRLHTRRELGLLIEDHFGDKSELDEDEVEIVQNALQLSERRVIDIMTPLDEVFFLYEDNIIDAQKIDDITAVNWSRIPILNRSKTECKRFLVLKDMVDIDFDERSYELSELKTHAAKTVGSRTALDTMFRKFIAAKKHLLIVERSNKIVGIVTVEDLFESIVGHELADETDVEQHRS